MPEGASSAACSSVRALPRPYVVGRQGAGRWLRLVLDPAQETKHPLAALFGPLQQGHQQHTDERKLDREQCSCKRRLGGSDHAAGTGQPRRPLPRGRRRPRQRRRAARAPQPNACRPARSHVHTRCRVPALLRRRVAQHVSIPSTKGLRFAGHASPGVRAWPSNCSTASAQPLSINTHLRQELDRDSNRTDRYTKAVEQLVHDGPRSLTPMCSGLGPRPIDDDVPPDTP